MYKKTHLLSLYSYDYKGRDYMFSSFSDELKKIINGSKKEMKLLHHSYIGTEHFVLSILKYDNDIKKILNKFGIDYDTFKNKIIENLGIGKDNVELFIFTPLFKKIIEDSIFYSTEEKNDKVDLSMMFKVMLDEGEGVAFRIFCDLGIDLEMLYDSINTSIIKNINNCLLNEIGINLNDKAQNSDDLVIGREKEIDNIIKILLRKNKRNPILIGDAGVGKTAIVEGLSQRIVSKNVPYKLMNKKIISISIASLVSGTKYRGEFEEKLLKIIKELEKNKDYILFVDEIHTIMGAGGAEGAIDASNILKPSLARDNITIIGATTNEEYKKYIEDDKAFARRFQKVIIREPSEKDLLNILNKVKISYEKYHNVIINKSILEYIIKVSKKYIYNRKEPDRSIDILDEVSSLISSKISDNQIKYNNLKNDLIKIKDKKNNYLNNHDFQKALECRKKERTIESKINMCEINISKTEIPFKVRNEDVNKVISQKYNVYISNSKNIKNEFEKQKKELKKIFVNQNDQIDDIFSIIKNIFVGDFVEEKPISFLFHEEDKNLFIKKIAELLFNDNIIEVDLREYSDAESINKILGSPPGYVGYNNKSNVFESLKDNPIAIILFKNYEYSNNKIKNLIKQILEKGYFIDSNNCKICFLNTLIIIESNMKNNNNIGFMNGKNIYDDLDLSKIVSKKIIFNNK